MKETLKQSMRKMGKLLNPRSAEPVLTEAIFKESAPVHESTVQEELNINSFQEIGLIEKISRLVGFDQFPGAESLLKAVENVINELDSLKEKLAQIKEIEEQLSQIKESLEILGYKSLEELIEDNARLKKRFMRNSHNSSIPTGRDLDTPTAQKKQAYRDKPSEEQGSEDEKAKTKSANQYNNRKPTNRKQGGQIGHEGKNLSKTQVEELMQHPNTIIERVDFGDKDQPIAAQVYKLDYIMVPHITEYNYHKGCEEKNKHKGPFYGENLKALCATLNTTYNLSYESICDLIKSMSEEKISLSSGSVVNFVKEAAQVVTYDNKQFLEEILSQSRAHVDFTTTRVDKEQKKILVFCTDEKAYYYPLHTRSKKELIEKTALPDYQGILVHDNEKVFYHFGKDHQECLPHVLRYCYKNYDQTGNSWIDAFAQFFNVLMEMRKDLMAQGKLSFSEHLIQKASEIYDLLLIIAEEQSSNTKIKEYKKDEENLIKRLRKYKHNHLLFMTDFCIPPDNNLAERMLRTVKTKQKVSGGFRTFEGLEWYASILTFLTNQEKGKELKALAQKLKGI